MKYYFNPNYKLIDDKNKVVLLSRYSFSRKDPRFEGDIQFQTFIHPIYASLLAFFKGNDLETTFNEIHTFFGIPLDVIKTQLLKIINNKEQQYIDFEDTSIVFPEHTIIASNHIIEEYEILDPESFLNFSEVDINPSRTSKPIDLTLMLNTKCHTNCIYCYADRRNKIDCQISDARINEIIIEANQLGMRGFDLIGGEVFLHKNWYGIMENLIKYDFPPFVSTKLPLTNIQIERVSNLKLPELQFSLDVISPNKLTKLLNINGEKYLSNIKVMFENLKHYNINITIHTVLSKDNCNLEDLKQLYEFLRNYNISVWKIDYVQKSLFTREDFSKIKVSVNDVVSTTSYLRGLSQLETKFKIQFSDIISQKQNGLIKAKDDFLFHQSRSCPANVSSFFILPDGNVTICEQLFWEKEYLIGNVKEQSLLEIWNSDAALTLYNRRKKIENKESPCYSCEESNYCHSNSLVCFRDVVFSYGFDNWDYPDPRCFKASKPIYDLQ